MREHAVSERAGALLGGRAPRSLASGSIRLPVQWWSRATVSDRPAQGRPRCKAMPLGRLGPPRVAAGRADAPFVRPGPPKKRKVTPVALSYSGVGSHTARPCVAVKPFHSARASTWWVGGQTAQAGRTSAGRLGGRAGVPTRGRRAAGGCWRVRWW
jgi:hypothetical protein